MATLMLLSHDVCTMGYGPGHALPIGGPKKLPESSNPSLVSELPLAKQMERGRELQTCRMSVI